MGIDKLPLFLAISAVCAPGALCRPQTLPDQNSAQVKGDPSAGKKLFENHCALCHGIDGGGGRGPNLHRPKLDHAADDAALRALIQNGIAPEMPGGWFLSTADIANIAAYVRSIGKVAEEKLPGDPLRGKAIYEKSGCLSCHILAGEGNGFGPELTEIGARRGALQLRDTLKNPASTIPEGFLLVEAVTLDGKTIRGIRLNEDTFSIQLKDYVGRLHSLRKRELKSLKKLRDETPMPAYGSTLTGTEIDDLIAYLAAQRGRS
jgi:cytochrome c oxidase cbb3-type subunit III